MTYNELLKQNEAMKKELEYIKITSEKQMYLNDLNNHCFIQHILETKDYILKEIIFSNGEENSFSKIIK